MGTNSHSENEAAFLKIYNSIREIESTFRNLTTDVELSPIYHKNDNARMAYLHLGLLG
jgi:transposase